MLAITIRFVLSKGAGNLPDLSVYETDSEATRIVRASMVFEPDMSELQDVIESWKFVDDGLQKLAVRSEEIDGYPVPVVTFFLRQPVDHTTFLRKIWQSAYKLQMPGALQEDAFYFEDHNGYSETVSPP